MMLILTHIFYYVVLGSDRRERGNLEASDFPEPEIASLRSQRRLRDLFCGLPVRAERPYVLRPPEPGLDALSLWARDP